MAYKPRTLTEIERDALAAARVRLPEYDWSLGSDNRARLSLVATAAWHLQAEAGRVERDLLPDTAGESGLERWGAILRVPRNGATIASRPAALRVRGTPGSEISAGETLTYPATGAQYQILDDATLPASGELDLNVASTATGSIARLEAGQVLEFDAAPVGLEAEAVLVRDLFGGLDREPLEQWRQRILRRFTESGALVTATDWQSAAESLDTVDRAYVYPLRGGVGTVDIAVLRTGRGASRVLTASELVEVRAYLGARRMVAMRSWRVLDVQVRAVDIELAIKERSNALAWDWGNTESVAITGYDAGTRTMTLATRPDDLVRGTRLVIADQAGILDGAISTVLDIQGSDQIAIDDDHGYSFANGDVIWPAGELTEPVRAAAFAHLDALGPALGNPGGDWDDSIRRGSLEAAIFAAVADVRDIQTVAPAGDVAPNDPPSGFDDQHVELLIPGRVLVRRAA